jgi:hypothetical protein
MNRYIGYFLLFAGLVSLGIVAANAPAWMRNLLLAGSAASVAGGFIIHKITGAAANAPAQVAGK